MWSLSLTGQGPRHLSPEADLGARIVGNAQAVTPVIAPVIDPTPGRPGFPRHVAGDRPFPLVPPSPWLLPCGAQPAQLPPPAPGLYHHDLHVAISGEGPDYPQELPHHLGRGHRAPLPVEMKIFHRDDLRVVRQDPQTT